MRGCENEDESRVLQFLAQRKVEMGFEFWDETGDLFLWEFCVKILGNWRGDVGVGGGSE